MSFILQPVFVWGQHPYSSPSFRGLQYIGTRLLVEKQLTWEIFQLAILLIATHTFTSSEIRVDKWSAEMCRKASEIRKLKAMKYPITSKKYVQLAWWRHQMETFSALLAICAGNSPHKGQWRGALMFFFTIFDVVFFICAWINGWVNNGEAGDLRRYRAHYDVTVMWPARELVLLHAVTFAGPGLNIKTTFPSYGDSHVKDKTAARPSYL